MKLETRIASSDGRLAPGRPTPPASDERHDPVLVIHGTFANPGGGGSREPHWWEPGGAFCRQLDVALERHGVHARCWSGLDRRVFRWSGDNLEVARRAAARELVAYLKALDADPAVTRYHIVAHSHGGQVVRLARRQLPMTGKAASVVYLGTPFLAFDTEPDRPGRTASINWSYVATALLVGSVAAVTRNWFWLVSAVALVKPIVDYYREQQSRVSLERTGVALRLPGDEAIQLLKHAAPLLEHPAEQRRVVNDLLTSQESAGSYQAADYVPWVAAQALDGWRRLEQVRSGGGASPNGLATGPGSPLSLIGWASMLLAIVPAVLFSVAVLVAKPILFVLDRARRAALRVALRRGLKAAASMVFGINVRGLRFRPSASGRPPFGIFEYPVPADATHVVEEHLRRLDPGLLREVRTALTAPSIDGLAGHLRKVFTGVGLAHGQYYAHPGMVDACARALAVEPACWRRLEEERLWSDVETGRIGAGGVIAERLGRIVGARPPEPLPPLFVLDTAPWTGVEPQGVGAHPSDAASVLPLAASGVS